MATPKQIVTDDGKKSCTKCKEIKFLSEFSVDSRCTSGRSSRCKKCLYVVHKERYKTNEVFRDNCKTLSRKSVLKLKYGLSPEDYQNLIISQNNCCTICNIVFDNTDKKRSINIDHNHTTGEVRQLLCQLCNTGLGMFREDISLLESAISYLRIHSG